MEEEFDLFERYKLLVKDIKFQLNYIDDFYVFDFNHLDDTIFEMKEIQQKILKSL